MGLSTVFSLLLFLIACFGLYKLIALARRKIKEKSSILPEYVSDLQTALGSINACQNVDELKSVLGRLLRQIPKYHRLLSVMGKEREDEIRKKPRKSFEKRERRIRMIWLIQFLLSYGLSFAFMLLMFVIAIYKEPNLSSSGLINTLTMVGLAILFFWFYFHCVYRKKGTILLTINLTFFLLVYIISLAENYLVFSKWHELLFGSVAFAISWGISAYLLKINHESRARQQLAFLLSEVEKSNSQAQNPQYE